MRSVFPSLLRLVHSCFLKILCKYCLFCVLASHRAGFLSVTWAPLHHTTCYLALEYPVDWSASCWILTRFKTKSIIPLNKHFWVLIWPSQLPRTVPRTHRCSVNLQGRENKQKGHLDKKSGHDDGSGIKASSQVEKSEQESHSPVSRSQRRAQLNTGSWQTGDWA